MKQTTRRERILVYGGFKVGKSYCWLDIANTYYKAGNTDVHFYVIDTDFGVPKMLDEGFGHLEDAEMLTVYSTLEFPELMKASKEIHRKAKKGDWIVIDMLEYGWTEAQRFYTEGVFGDSMENYFLQMRKQVVAKGGKDARAYGGYEGTDWNFISRIYKEWEFPLTMKSPANVFAVTGERKLDGGRGDAPEKIKQYKDAGGMAPVGQKGIGHRFDTLARMTKRANGQRQLTVVGDRGREDTFWDPRESRLLNIDSPPKAFARRYLVDVAGWTKESKKASGSKPRRSGGKKKGTSQGRRRR